MEKSILVFIVNHFSLTSSSIFIATILYLTRDLLCLPLLREETLFLLQLLLKKQEESHLRAVFASNYTKDLYIGQTGRRLDQRLCKHKRAVKTADFNSSALAEHAWSAGHAVDWENVSIVNRCPDYISFEDC